MDEAHVNVERLMASTLEPLNMSDSGAAGTPVTLQLPECNVAPEGRCVGTQ